LVDAQDAASPNGKGTGGSRIVGRVVDLETGDPLPYVNIALIGTNRGTSSGPDGEFSITDVAAGPHSLQFTYLGYSVLTLEIPASENPNPGLVVELAPQPLSYKEVVVTPGVFSIMGSGPTVRQSLTREDLETVPFGEDIYRATASLPGISGSDFSAKFTVRGGENDQVLVLFDGLELYDPFHLKDIEGGALSIIDVAAVEGIDLMTGGFPVAYGNHMSGVFNIRSVRPNADRMRTSVGLSFMNARIMSQGGFAGDKGRWLFSARRGYLDMVLDLMGEEDPPRPVYYDVLGKAEYQLHPKHRLSVDVLYAHDRLNYVEDDDDEDQTSYANGYVWLALRSVPSKRLFVQTVGSYANVTHDRNGTAYTGDRRTLDFTVADRQQFDVVGIKQDWSLDVTDRLLLKWGADFKSYVSEYDYFSTKLKNVAVDPPTLRTDTTMVELDPSGTTLGAYLSTRFQLAGALTVEPGLRYDHNSFTDDDLLSPRFNAAYAVGKHTFIRGGWGYFYQSEGIHEIRVGEGERMFQSAQLAKHWVAGVEHTFRKGYNLRVEGYYKDESRLRPDYRNFSNTLEIFPELQDDRFKVNLRGAVAKGVEAFFKYDRGGKWTWWSSYAFAFVKDDIRSVVFDGVEYTEGNGEYDGKNDQRHTVSLDLNYRPNRAWRFNVSWHYRSGWPYTPLLLMTTEGPNGTTQYYASYGDFNSAHYPPYHRLDFSVNRHFKTPRGPVSLFLAIINVYNHGNVRNIEYDRRTDPRTFVQTLTESNEYWFKLLPSIGVNWTIDR
jgi:outer membrane cobalamin receptor